METVAMETQQRFPIMELVPELRQAVAYQCDSKTLEQLIGTCRAMMLDIFILPEPSSELGSLGFHDTPKPEPEASLFGFADFLRGMHCLKEIFICTDNPEGGASQIIESLCQSEITLERVKAFCPLIINGYLDYGASLVTFDDELGFLEGNVKGHNIKHVRFFPSDGVKVNGSQLARLFFYFPNIENLVVHDPDTDLVAAAGLAGSLKKFQRLTRFALELKWQTTQFYDLYHPARDLDKQGMVRDIDVVHLTDWSIGNKWPRSILGKWEWKRQQIGRITRTPN
ncbi:Uu.00g018440.m01.CDS01 [Anthostomella pinea]|uniref:Uu.00g018440.m01.CDS01 n=1 Tax=Anthostomella pinea TaxID=933095 RepID=A0AAI8VZZ4_9PEZI|nr:Uu.00g018440.m01.CDS01 [Anthostomella pinea]